MMNFPELAPTRTPATVNAHNPGYAGDPQMRRIESFILMQAYAPSSIITHALPLASLSVPITVEPTGRASGGRAGSDGLLCGRDARRPGWPPRPRLASSCAARSWSSPGPTKRAWAPPARRCADRSPSRPPRPPTAMCLPSTTAATSLLPEIRRRYDGVVDRVLLYHP